MSNNNWLYNPGLNPNFSHMALNYPLNNAEFYTNNYPAHPGTYSATNYPMNSSAYYQQPHNMHPYHQNPVATNFQNYALQSSPQSSNLEVANHFHTENSLPDGNSLYQNKPRFCLQDRQIMIQVIIKHNGYYDALNQDFWKKVFPFESLDAWHTAKSLVTHYKTTILPNIEEYLQFFNYDVNRHFSKFPKPTERNAAVSAVMRHRGKSQVAKDLGQKVLPMELILTLTEQYNIHRIKAENDYLENSKQQVDSKFEQKVQTVEK